MDNNSGLILSLRDVVLTSPALPDEKEAARAAAKANRSTAAPQAPPTAPETDALPEVSDDGVDATSSSDDEGAGEEGGFWVPPPGARRDEDREEELAQEDVAMTDAGEGSCGQPLWHRRDVDSRR